MGGDGSGQMGLNCPFSGIAGLAMNSRNMFKTPLDGGDCFYSSGWDPIVSMSQGANFGPSSVVAHGGFSDPSHTVHYSARPSVGELVPNFPDLSGWNYSGLVSPFGLPGHGQNFASIFSDKYASSKGVPIETTSMGLVPTQEYCQILEETAPVASPNGRIKRAYDSTSPLNPNKIYHAEVDVPQDLSGGTSEPNGSDGKKRKIERNRGPDQFTKQTGKQVKDDSQGGETTKNNYAHKRARRGQATNSHSLAERVRREKIGERMRALQELVPGCSKITGKAVMLDEIINYVQSLQQQVEFLSMKLATVNPELNFDINHFLSKDILQLRGNDASLLGFNPGTSSTHSYAPAPEIHRGAVPEICNTSTYLSVPQVTWDGEMQSLFHMGLDSNPALANLGTNGNSRPEP